MLNLLSLLSVAVLASLAASELTYSPEDHQAKKRCIDLFICSLNGYLQTKVIPLLPTESSLAIIK